MRGTVSTHSVSKSFTQRLALRAVGDGGLQLPDDRGGGLRIVLRGSAAKLAPRRSWSNASVAVKGGPSHTLVCLRLPLFLLDLGYGYV